MIQKIINILSFFILPISSTYLQDSELKIQFSNFIKQYNKQYYEDELITRFLIFKDNIKKIQDHNDGVHSWKMEINEFADLSSEEFKNKYTRFNGHVYSLRRTEFPLISVEVPSEIDWEKKGAVTGVKDQGQCGSCYSFSTTGSVEGAYFLSTGKLVSFSEQQIVDCSSSYGNQGCQGGLMTDSLQYIEENGICSEEDYEYNAVEGTCKKCKSITKVDSFVNIVPNSEKALQQALIQQPISIAVVASGSNWQFYSSGIITDCPSTTIDHGVLLTSYGTSDGVDYWGVKNSWGSSWGENGYIRLARNVKQTGGTCGLTSMASYPVINKTEIY